MKKTVILNGISKDYIQQCHSVSGFLKDGDTAVVLYADGDRKQEYIANCPVVDMTLLQIKEYNPEDVVGVLEKFVDGSIVLFPPNIFGNEMATRLAYRKEGTSIHGVHSIEQEVYHKKAYGNHMDVGFVPKQLPLCMTVEKGVEPKEYEATTEGKVVKEIDATSLCASEFVLEKEITFVEKENWGDNPCIVAVGNGVKSKEKLEDVIDFARRMDGQWGVSRPVAMSAVAPLERLLGASGEMVAPDLCIALGVSGSPAFMAGIEKAKCIIAVNADEKAPILRQCDLAIVGDYEEFLQLWSENQ